VDKNHDERAETDSDEDGRDLGAESHRWMKTVTSGAPS
jgi:hypothetical protein